MVLPGRIELPTSALPRMRSTTELRQQAMTGPDRRADGRAPVHDRACEVKPAAVQMVPPRQGAAASP